MTQLVKATDITTAKVSRRRFAVGAFWVSLAGLAAAAGGTIVNTMWPRGVKGFGGPVSVPASRIPAPGAPPVRNQDGRFWLVNLDPGEGQLTAQGSATDGGLATPGGLVALWTKCPHLGCSVPWDGAASVADDDRRGWFRCPCHGSTYTKAGVRVFGPAERSMDTMRIEVVDGGIVVQTGDRTRGADDNPLRTTPWPPSVA